MRASTQGRSVSKDWAKVCRWKKKKKNCFENLSTSCDWANRFAVMVVVVVVAVEIVVAVGSLTGRRFHIVVVGWRSYKFVVVDHKVVLAVCCHRMTYFAEVDMNHLDMVVAVSHCSSDKMFAMVMAVGSLTGRRFHIVVVG